MRHINDYISTLAFVFLEAFAEVFAQSVSPSPITIGGGKNSQAVSFLKIIFLNESNVQMSKNHIFNFFFLMFKAFYEFTHGLRLNKKFKTHSWNTLSDHLASK